jgi:hypothetical protein
MGLTGKAFYSFSFFLSFFLTITILRISIISALFYMPVMGVLPLTWIPFSVYFLPGPAGLVIVDVVEIPILHTERRQS